MPWPLPAAPSRILTPDLPPPERNALSIAEKQLPILLLTCSLTYRPGVAGVYFMVPILISNTVTFAYMAIKGIGLNINTLQVAALGIDLGVDYAIYVVDSIKESYARTGDMDQAVRCGFETASRGVVVTATPLIASTALWYLFSSLRFQAEMPILIAVWMAVSATSALLVMPALTYTFRPRFITSRISGTGSNL